MSAIQKLVEAFFDLPHATIIADVSIVLIVIAYCNGTLSFDEAMVALGASTAGAGVLGFARNGAGRGVKK